MNLAQLPRLPKFPKHTLRIAKLVLLAALALVATIAIETRFQLVKALEVEQPLIAVNPMPQTAKPPVQSPEVEFTLEPLQPSESQPATAQPQAAPTASQPPATRPQQIALAVDSGEVSRGAEPNGRAIDPNLLRLNEWQGSSFPVENFQVYTSPFGYRRSPTGGYSQEFHYGLDMAAPEGSYIRNWWTGIVVEVSDNSNCGTSVVVESGSWLHIYCHMQGHVEVSNGRRYMIDRSGGLQIMEGQEVLAGQRIGRVGMTGRTTGPHLHWGLKYDNNWVDPGLVLRAMYAGQQSATRITNP